MFLAYSILGLELCWGLKNLCQMPQIGVGELCKKLCTAIKCNWDSNKQKKEFLLPKIYNKNKKNVSVLAEK